MLYVNYNPNKGGINEWMKEGRKEGRKKERKEGRKEGRKREGGEEKEKGLMRTSYKRN